ncbi:MAG: signal peptidase I [Saprospiraceae bacterium]
MSILIFLLISYILLSISLYVLFPKAGVPAIKGLIPGVNFMEWAKLIGRKPTYALLLLIPIVNIFIFTGMAVDLVRSFGKLQFKHTALAVIYAPAIFAKLATSDQEKYEGPILEMEHDYAAQLEAAEKSGDKYSLKKLQEDNPYKKGGGREWIESVVFAVFAAAFIRMFLIEAYVIPTPSMEGSLNVGDFLFVSKAHYGIRTPMTVAMFPLLHNRLPLIGGESYLESPSLPYYRLPAIEDIQRGKPFVFNWPVGDSIYLTPQRSWTADQVKRQGIKTNGKLITRPIDKKDHYIKRAVGIAGDTLQVIDGLIHIDGIPEKVPSHRQFGYDVTLGGGAIIDKNKLDDLGIDEGDSGLSHYQGWKFLSINTNDGKKNYDLLFLDDKQVVELKKLFPKATIDRIKQESDENRVFPNNKALFPNWTVDDYGPIYIPKVGDEITMTPKNMAIYGRLIKVYEGNTVTKKGSQYQVNGVPTKKYTVKQNYYWAMGDNRHNSEDSRAWGFVPHDHVVGKPLFIWFSTKEGSITNGINWDRIFKSASAD